MSSNSNSTRDYEVGWGKPPVEHQFKPNQSGNPSGKRRAKAPTSLTDAIRDKLLEPLSRTSGTRRRMTRRRLGIRKLVDDAWRGDIDALKNLLRIRDEAGPRKLAEWKKVSFAEGLRMNKDRWHKFTDEFFAEQDRKKAEARKAARSDNIPMADLIDQELGRTIRQDTADGKWRRFSMVQLIATQFANQHGLGNREVIKLLQKMFPENRYGKANVVYEIARPEGEWADWLEERRRANERNEREAWEELGLGPDGKKKG